MGVSVGGADGADEGAAGVGGAQSRRRRSRACTPVCAGRACAGARGCACACRTLVKSVAMGLMTLRHGIWKSRSLDNLRGAQEVVEVGVGLVRLRVEQDVLPQCIVPATVAHRHHSSKGKGRGSEGL